MEALDPSYIFIGLSIFLLGVSKGGFGGIGGSVALPLMTLAVDPSFALGALLPILMAADIISVGAHRKHADFKTIYYALPAAVVGVVLGAALIAVISKDAIALSIGVISIAFAYFALTGAKIDISKMPSWTSALAGALSGFTSSLAHAGGPPIQIYFLAKGYSTQQFVATSAVFMAGINLIKVIPFIVVGALNTKALILAAILAPFAMISAYIGVIIARRISAGMFKILVNSLLIIAGTKLILDSVF